MYLPVQTIFQSEHGKTVFFSFTLRTLTAAIKLACSGSYKALTRRATGSDVVDSTRHRTFSENRLESTVKNEAFCLFLKWPNDYQMFIIEREQVLDLYIKDAAMKG